MESRIEASEKHRHRPAALNMRRARRPKWSTVCLGGSVSLAGVEGWGRGRRTQRGMKLPAR